MWIVMNDNTKAINTDAVGMMEVFDKKVVAYVNGGTVTIKKFESNEKAIQFYNELLEYINRGIRLIWITVGKNEEVAEETKR